MFIIDSTETIQIIDGKGNDFNGVTYYKALVQFSKGLEWISVSKPIPLGKYEGFTLTFDKGKVTLSV